VNKTKSEPGQIETITGSVERITFYNPENGYSVVRLRPEGRHTPRTDRDGTLTITGNLPELNPGEHLRLQGRWVNHASYGTQFAVEVCEQTLPATVAGIRRYLGSGLVKGIGPRLADRIVAQFGQNTLDVIESEPQRLGDVPDIGPKRTRLIAAAWQEQKQVKEIMLFLHSHGVSTNLAVKVYKQYGAQALDVVRTDPYRLARDIHGVGFKTADKLAQALGLPADHPSRLEAGMVYLLNEMSDDGHVFAPQAELIRRSAELLSQPAELLPAALERLMSQDRVQVETVPLAGAQQPAERGESSASERRASETRAGYGTPAGTPAVYLAPLYQSEKAVAERLSTLNYTLPSRLSDLPPAFLNLDSQLSEQQQAAVQTALTHPLSILTGGPGTGKTTAIKALIAALEQGRKRVALASPTGRAAKRLSEATGRPASTIHRLLGYSPAEGFKHNAKNPLPVDMLVVDEASMLDMVLANTLLKALQPGTHLLLVGDVDQLPSVGAGDVLRDVIDSGLAPVTRLSLIFRQAAGSHIITNAHRINQGEMPIFERDSQDFFLFPAQSVEEAADWVEQVVCTRIPGKFNLNPREQVQVLAPMYRGPVGVMALNTRLQAALNPPAAGKPEKLLFGSILRLGDKVMQTQNNYDKEVYNGDIGVIIGLDLVEHRLMVDFEGKPVNYDWLETDQLTLAYAVSVHKAQGSEFPAVVLPLVSAHYMMLQRNLLYTAVTRAKKLCVVVGSQKAIAMAVHNNKVAQRYTALDWRLRGSP
jgi:exodeoxyribonuclease V alpha subunit